MYYDKNVYKSTAFFEKEEVRWKPTLAAKREAKHHPVHTTILTPQDGCDDYYLPSLQKSTEQTILYSIVFILRPNTLLLQKEEIYSLASNLVKCTAWIVELHESIQFLYRKEESII